MRSGILLGIACLVVGARILPAQERLPEPAQSPGGQAPAPLMVEQPAPPTGPPVPYAPPPPASLPPPYAPLPDLRGGPTGSPVIVLGDPVGNPGFWVGVDALLWWTKNQPLSVPLITTGPASQGANAGNLGVPGTTSLVGPFDYHVAGGARLVTGGWFDCDHTIGMDGSLFFLGRQSASFGVADRSGMGNFVINEPLAGIPFSTQVSAPGLATGAALVDVNSRLDGGDINILYNLGRGSGWSVNLVGGFRYLELDEALTITANSNVFTTITYTDSMGNVLATAPPGSTISMVDRFGTRNQFSGGQIGATFQCQLERWSVGGSAKVAIGATHEVITIDGNTNVYPVNADPVPLAGGNYASLQIGRYAVNRFAVAPEAQLNVGYQITPCCRALVGYDFLYLSSAARPGNQIDNTYDGAARPTVFLANSSYWAQGLTMSLQFSY